LPAGSQRPTLDLNNGCGSSVVAMARNNATWPESLASIGALRFARRSAHFEETVHFYRDLVGLPLCATFGEIGRASCRERV